MINSIWVTWPSLVKFGTLGVAAAGIMLSLERGELLENNLIPVEDLEEINASISCDERSLGARTEDGTCNILENPAEGSVYRRFGRNVELAAAYGETEDDTLLTPNPRDVSNSLMARDTFQPATSINFIAAAWIQFMVHDWFSHGPNQIGNEIEVDLPEGDSLGTGSLSVQRTMPDSDRSTEDDTYLPPTYRNMNTHWWDGSQLYGSSKETSDAVRAFADGKLKLDSDNTLPTDFWSGVPITGFNDNWWLGLSMMHQIFTLEHNRIADMLKTHYPQATDQWLYDKARLINSALMAKIHTVEWTPALLQNPALELSMEANWWGVSRDRETRDSIQAAIDDIKGPNSWIINTVALFDPEKAEALSTPGAIEHALGGLVGQSAPNNYGVDFTLTEEFVAVYRMHPLLRDTVDVYDIGSNIVSAKIPLNETRDGEAEDILDEQGGDRLWYSFGITNPGSLTLNNYPEFLRNLSIPFGDIDLATIDILRDRERGVPRYNEFRRQIGLNPINTFEDLTSDPETLAELKRLYNNDVEQIDALVGQLAETVRPDGFAFGETAFQIFILNASRRLMTDRFYTESYTPEVYTAEGIDWVESNTMVDVIKRHFPNLNLSLTGVENAFKPWDLKIPDNYKDWSACDKASLLWTNGALRTEYSESEMPELTNVDIGGLIDSILWEKVKRKDDVAPLGYEKPIHAHGSMATVRFEAAAGHPYTGLFKGAECGLLRLSVTGNPGDRGFAPGLAWKAFVDGQDSRNVSALYTLSGQGDNHNFFANELSQYVDKEVNETLGTTALFSLVSTKPTTLMVTNMANVNSDGSNAESTLSPSQIYFVPRPEVKDRFSSEAHDFRSDLNSLPEGTPLYDVYATSKTIRTSIFPYFHNKYRKDRRESAVKVGTLRMTSRFTSSAFGDGGVFFNHQRYEDR